MKKSTILIGAGIAGIGIAAYVLLQQKPVKHIAAIDYANQDNWSINDTSTGFEMDCLLLNNGDTYTIDNLEIESIEYVNMATAITFKELGDQSSYFTGDITNYFNVGDIVTIGPFTNKTLTGGTTYKWKLDWNLQSINEQPFKICAKDATDFFSLFMCIGYNTKPFPPSLIKIVSSAYDLLRGSWISGNDEQMIFEKSSMILLSTEQQRTATLGYQIRNLQQTTDSYTGEIRFSIPQTGWQPWTTFTLIGDTFSMEGGGSPLHRTTLPSISCANPYGINLFTTCGGMNWNQPWMTNNHLYQCNMSVWSDVGINSTCSS